MNPAEDLILQKVRDFADRAHGEQLRKYTPDRYIVHPVRVMETCNRYDNRLPILCAALLHDVLEDTAVDGDQLLAFLRTVMSEAEADETLMLVEELTDVYVKSNYPQWNRRTRKDKELERFVQTSPDAQTIKYADILDNSKEIGGHDTDFAPRYLRECRAILEKADRGNAALRQEALSVVSSGLRKLERF
jgi:(p)ppGpp synthase/HD superfamily hydrolase